MSTAAAKEEPPTFADVPVDERDATNHRRRLVCVAHGSAVCGWCCADFVLLNRLRYDAPYLLLRAPAQPADARIARIEEAIGAYYRCPDGVDFSGAGGGPAGGGGRPDVAPQMAGLLDALLGTDATDGHAAVTLVSYMCYAARSLPAARVAMSNLMDAALQSMPGGTEAVLIGELEESKHERKAKMRKEKAHRKEQPKENGREKMLGKMRSNIESSVEGMLLVLTKAGATSLGTFFDDFMTIMETMAESEGARAACLKDLGDRIASMGVGDDDEITITDELQKQMGAQIQWMEFMLKHCDGVPMDDPAAWSTGKLTQFLKQHAIDPKPVPPKAALTKTARHLKKFCLACMKAVNSAPDDEEAAALGREAMGTADDADRAKIRHMYPSAERQTFLIDPQLPSGAELSALPRLCGGGCSPFGPTFEAMRRAYADTFGTRRSGIAEDGREKDIYDGLLRILTVVAQSLDIMRNDAGQDILVCVDADKNKTTEQTLAIRALDAFEVGQERIQGGIHPIPLVVVEYLHGRKSKAGARHIQTFTAGLRRGTLFRTVNASTEEIDLLRTLLEDNRKELAEQDTLLQTYEKEGIHKGWKLSVVRPADPNKAGGAKSCLCCPNRASKTCGRCGTAGYCSSACQRKDWATHKKTCRKPSRPTGGARSCLRCGNDASKMCSRCGAAAYCSDTCQREDWGTHKKQCRRPSRAATDGEDRGRVVLVDVGNTAGDPMAAEQARTGVPARLYSRNSGVLLPNDIFGNIDRAPKGIFQVKVQVSIVGTGIMMCYDQTRQFQFRITEQNCAGAQELDSIVRARGEMGGKKAYFNATIRGGGNVAIFVHQLLGPLPW